MYQKSKDTPPLGSLKEKRLTHKQELFVREYLVTLNAAEAVRRAGYNTKNANRLGTELLHHPTIRHHIEQQLDKKRERLTLSADYVIQKLISIIEDTEKDNPQAALRALELAGKHLGMYKERQEISGPDGQAIEMEQRIKEDVADFTSKLARLTEQTGAGGVVKLPKPSGAGRA